ncbi:MAG: hypothetical protein KKE44_10165 [Proteobacteria bacterium]|nr:hypothetical protein [Pseudomonadota bacterium]MBU1583087.1 hypothetical protein [Pseudomonadota bacterium]MBU2455210.1 hypothetical protein [Pseudomonadota bacterium]MBU2630474.1 hypothetical protein [Pseudomonadota bacterium]
MNEQKICKDINSRTIKISMVDGTLISACVNLDRDPGYNRLSDLISSDREPFLILMNSTMQKPGVKIAEKHDTLFINKEHILWATPENNNSA